jgi:hypothetical protein
MRERLKKEKEAKENREKAEVRFCFDLRRRAQAD